jgi:MFS family permease
LVPDPVTERPSGPWVPFRWPDFRCLFAAAFCSTFASRALAVVLGYEVYKLTKDPLALGMLGLIEVIPAVSLALYGGHVADRRDRRQILRFTLGALVVCGCALSAVEAVDIGKTTLLLLLYGVVFLAGIARGFAEPAAQALEAQVVPIEMLMNSSTLMATCWLSAAVVGPLAGGFAYQRGGPSKTFAAIAALYALAWVATTRISPRTRPAQPQSESVWESVSAGVRYVLHDQILLGSMSLDLFAVLFGGAIAMLPVFAEMLHVDATGLGMLTAAPTAGALVTMVWATRHPPVRHAGRTLFIAVAGFGVSMIVFALSRTFWLSMVALAFSGMFDGVSVVIRRAINRLFSPDHLRGRIASVSTIFIGSSNELGAFESGMMAAWLGTARSVWIGGILTLIVVAVAGVLAPKLRNLSLDPKQVLRRDQEVDRELLEAEETGESPT